MRTFSIAFRLDNVTDDPAALLDRIKSFVSWWHGVDSVWMVCSDLSPSAIRDDLSEVMPPGQLLVVDVTGQSWAHVGIDSEGSEWLKEHVL